MADTSGTYLLARVHKAGELTDQVIFDSILNPKPILVRKNAWTFIRVIGFNRFIYGELVKYEPDGEVTIIDDGVGTENQKKEPNLKKASSPFVFIPEFSGICFMKASRQITERNFGKRFSKIIRETNDDFFVECEVEMIADLQGFIEKLSVFTSIERIYAKVFPTNPLFGHYWKSLDEYLKKRNTNTLKIDETSYLDESIQTNLSSVAAQILSGAIEETDNVDITDQALLLAIDGYGSAIVEGSEKKVYRKLDTSMTTKNFQFSREPEPVELYKKAYEEFAQINKERGLSHK